jgi:photosystem II stability/assembly factor-like uncharacterized protein
MYYSFDGGNNWDQSSSVPGVEYGINAIQPVEGGIYIGTAIKGVFFTSNMGSEWQSRSLGLTNLGAMEIRAFTVRGAEIFVATVGGGIYKNSITTPAVWTHFSEGIPWNTSWSIYSLKNIDGDLYAGGGVNAYYYRNRKNTTVWEEIPFDWFAGEANGILAFEKYSGGILAVSHLGIYRSSDGGDNWLKYSPGVGLIEKSDIVVKGNKIVVTLSKSARYYILHSSNSGVSWWRDDMQSGSIALSMTICGGKIWVGRLDGLYYKPDILTDIKEPEVIPVEFSLHQNYPNPFNGSTSIEYALPEEGYVTIQLYDITGRMVKQLVKEHKTAGIHKTTVKSDDLASGIYVYTLCVNDIKISKKLVVLK